MPVADTIRVSELPISTTLNDDDFIIINTQNIVTQGIETEDFIDSIFDRDIKFTGSPVFLGDVYIDSNLVVDGISTFNNNITINGDLNINGDVSIKLDELNDVSVSSATAGQLLAYNAGSRTWVAIDPPTAPPSGGTSIPFQSLPPNGSTAGDLWLNSSTYKLYVWDGSWIATS